jgi:hypothetical protein
MAKSAPAINLMSAEQIQARIAELDRLETDFSARDLDAELAKVLRDGGNVDAIEAAQLDAERAARRLRAERIALNGELPNAVRRDGAEQLDALKRQHDALAATAPGMASKLAAAWGEFTAALNEWAALEDAAHEATRQAAIVADRSGADMPAGMGTFQSVRVAAIGPESREVWRKLISAADQQQTIAGLQGRRID